MLVSFLLVAVLIALLSSKTFSLLVLILILLVKYLFHHNSVMEADTTLQIARTNCAYSLAAPFR